MLTREPGQLHGVAHAGHDVNIRSVGIIKMPSNVGVAR